MNVDDLLGEVAQRRPDLVRDSNLQTGSGKLQVTAMIATALQELERSDLEPSVENVLSMIERWRPQAMARKRRHGPGRPAWDAARFRDHYQAALTRTKGPVTIPRLADNFEALDGTMGVDSDWLGKLIDRFEE